MNNNVFPKNGKTNLKHNIVGSEEIKYTYRVGENN